MRVAAKPPRGWKLGIGLQVKFTAVLAGILAVALVLLGLAMWVVSTRYLTGLRVQSGVEIAKAIAQVPVALRSRIEGRGAGRTPAPASPLTPEQARAMAAALLTDAVTWGRGDRATTDLSDIDSISIHIGRGVPDLDLLNGVYLAKPGEELAAVFPSEIGRVFIPKLDAEIVLPEGVSVRSGRREVASGDPVPIYRFLVDLPPEFGELADSASGRRASHIRVDIKTSSLLKVNANLLVILATCVAVAVAVAAAIAWWLARHITRPVRLLVRDMALVSKGDLDHRTKPHSADEIGWLAIEFNAMTAGLKQAQATALERERDQERSRSELQVATEVQRHLLPARIPDIPGCECSAHYQGAKGVSGDYFDFLDLGNGLVGLIIADVSGKGVPGAMVMAVMRTTMRLVAPQYGARAGEAFKTVNRLIAKQIKRGMFVTAMYGLLDTRTGVMTLASAGHNPLALYRAASGRVEFVAGKGIALGFNEGPIFDRVIEERRLQLDRGDCIVLYTDGFPEAMNAANEEFGDDRFLAAIARHAALGARQLINGVVSEIARHRGSAEQSDDLTMIALRRL